MVFYLPLQLADLVLQLPARAFEGVIDREGQIGIPLIILRGVADIDFAAVRKCEPDADLVQAALVVTVAWRLSTTRPAVIRLKRSSSWIRCLTMLLRTSGFASIP